MLIDIPALLDEHITVIRSLKGIIPTIEQAAEQMVACLSRNGKIFWMGNGGSAADAQHFAAELVGRFNRERKGLASIALTTDTSILTSVSNDYDFSTIFARQLEALCQPEDLVVAISTSGNSRNVLEGIKIAQERGAFIIGLTGQTGGQLSHQVDLCIAVPSTNTARIQEGHHLIGHILCGLVDEAVIAGKN